MTVFHQNVDIAHKDCQRRFLDITTRALLMAMPFENYVQMYDLKGKYLLEALEFSVGTTQNTSGDFVSSRMLQIGGEIYDHL
jgi:2',3'-cyclic-nucleotide 2'-phosphodiesterase (5'-nucleotidase family)